MRSGSRVAHVELEARLTRRRTVRAPCPRERCGRAGHARPVPTRRRAGGRWLGLHPREFALLWRLAETPGADHAPQACCATSGGSSARQKPIRWRCMSRACGPSCTVSRCGWLVRTEAQGSYRLAAARQPGAAPGAGDAPPTTGLVGHDAYQGRKSAAERHRHEFQRSRFHRTGRQRRGAGALHARRQDERARPGPVRRGPRRGRSAARHAGTCASPCCRARGAPFARGWTPPASAATRPVRARSPNAATAMPTARRKPR